MSVKRYGSPRSQLPERPYGHFVEYEDYDSLRASYKEDAKHLEEVCESAKKEIDRLRADYKAAVSLLDSFAEYMGYKDGQWADAHGVLEDIDELDDASLPKYLENLRAELKGEAALREFEENKVEQLERQLAEARANERERCAKVCDTMVQEHHKPNERITLEAIAAHECARRIRQLEDE